MTVDILPTAEAVALAEHEIVIERGIKTFYEVGMALADIRNRKLYRADYSTFEEYAEKRWQLSRPRAYELMAAAEIVSGIPDTLPKPSNAGQASALNRVPEPERTDVWAATVERTDGKPTAAAVLETYEQRQQPAPDLLAGDDWVQPAGPGFEAAVTPPPKPKRRPLPEAFTDAGRDLTRAAERLARLTEDDRFAKNRDTTHRQVPELLGALDHTVRLITAMNLPAAEASEEARRWWATSLNNLSDTLRGVANSLNQEQK
ncbi:hypothetical protein [Streptomyces zaomyceticus]|uniref:hypothetical protein n=1 Tax=Streptomyces zaomyceticus TaxID=68286 RepID=UPI0036BDBD08